MDSPRQTTIWLIVLFVLLGASLALYWRNNVVDPLVTGPISSTTDSSSHEEQAPTVPDIVMKAEAGRVVVIMYHNVIKERVKGSVWFDCTIDEFGKDMDSLVENGYTVLSTDQLFEHLTKGAPVPAKSIVLTFDDNYQGFYDYAVPILRKHKFPAAMFVHTAYVGSKSGYPKMTWEELKELRDEGLVTIGAHTVTHPSNLKDLPLDVQKKELEDSKADLEQHLGGKIDIMAYPDGSNDLNTQQLTRDAGYKMSFSTE
ncbi:MAG: polysaccharide deacetylase family protein, partial [Fimbriimonadales bacterium]